MELPIKDIVAEATSGTAAVNPTGRQEPGVSLEWIYPPSARLGQPLTCTLIVKSLSINRLHQVIVRSRIPSGATVKGTEPKAAAEGDILVWSLGDLEPRMERRIDIHLVPTVRGNLPCFAFVTFTGSSTASVQVREPKLAVKAAAPKMVSTGDVAVVSVTVSNPGDARTEHVRLLVGLPDGLEYRTGNKATFELDSLGPNESRTVLLQCAAKSTGSQVCSAVVTGEPGLEAQASAAVQVVAPQLQLTAAGPKMRYLDRRGVFTFRVTNPGDAPAAQVTLTNQVPAGFKVISATDGAYHDFATRSVVWFLGTLKPGQTREVSLHLLAINLGEYRNHVSVTATRGLRSTAEVATRIEGLPGLLMELVDLQDPIEVGKDLSYEIRVTNTGSKTETNLRLTCTMSDKMEFRGAKCSTGIDHKREGQDVIFGVIPRLAPRADVLYRVNVRCQSPGDLRFHASVMADGLESPVLREESTRVFGDDHDGGPLPGSK
jgi:uncharacterized repeat protein (TIGR01451 family)